MVNDILLRRLDDRRENSARVVVLPGVPARGDVIRERGVVQRHRAREAEVAQLEHHGLGRGSSPSPGPVAVCKTV